MKFYDYIRAFGLLMWSLCEVAFGFANLGDEIVEANQTII